MGITVNVLYVKTHTENNTGRETMTRNEAFKVMIDGYKITHKNWNGDYVFFGGRNFKYFSKISQQVNDLMSPMEIFNDGYEIYTEKKTEKVTWYKVYFHRKDFSSKAEPSMFFHKSKEDFLTTNDLKESDLHWIKLEEVMTHEYEVNE